jgi:hypothetical protein
MSLVQTFYVVKKLLNQWHFVISDVQQDAKNTELTVIIHSFQSKDFLSVLGSIFWILDEHYLQKSYMYIFSVL